MIEVKLKKWGSSLGLIIPKEIVLKERLKVGEQVLLNIKKKVTMRQIFGSLKDWKIDSQKLKDELRKEWDK